MGSLMTSEVGISPNGLPTSATLPGFYPVWTLLQWALPLGLAEGFSRPLALVRLLWNREESDG